MSTDKTNPEHAARQAMADRKINGPPVTADERLEAQASPAATPPATAPLDPVDYAGDPLRRGMVPDADGVGREETDSEYRQRHLDALAGSRPASIDQLESQATPPVQKTAEELIGQWPPEASSDAALLIGQPVTALEGVGYDSEILKGLDRDDTLMQFVVRRASYLGYFGHQLRGERAMLFGSTAALVLRCLDDGAVALGYIKPFSERAAAAEAEGKVWDWRAREGVAAARPKQERPRLDKTGLFGKLASEPLVPTREAVRSAYRAVLAMAEQLSGLASDKDTIAAAAVLAQQVLAAGQALISLGEDEPATPRQLAARVAEIMGELHKRAAAAGYLVSTDSRPWNAFADALDALEGGHRSRAELLAFRKWGENKLDAGSADAAYLTGEGLRAALDKHAEATALVELARAAGNLGYLNGLSCAEYKTMDLSGATPRRLRAGLLAYLKAGAEARAQAGDAGVHITASSRTADQSSANSFDAGEIGWRDDQRLTRTEDPPGSKPPRYGFRRDDGMVVFLDGHDMLELDFKGTERDPAFNVDRLVGLPTEPITVRKASAPALVVPVVFDGRKVGEAEVRMIPERSIIAVITDGGLLDDINRGGTFETSVGPHASGPTPAIYVQRQRLLQVSEAGAAAKIRQLETELDKIRVVRMDTSEDRAFTVKIGGQVFQLPIRIGQEIASASEGHEDESYEPEAQAAARNLVAALRRVRELEDGVRRARAELDTQSVDKFDEVNAILWGLV